MRSRASIVPPTLNRILGFAPPQRRSVARTIEDGLVSGVRLAAIGAAAMGVVAFGAVAVGALAVRRLAVGRARIRAISVDELIVSRLIVRNGAAAAQSFEPGQGAVTNGARGNGADQPIPATAELKPGDEAAPGTPGTGEQTCPVCGGSGVIGSQRCENCEGTGRITQGIGGG